MPCLFALRSTPRGGVSLQCVEMLTRARGIRPHDFEIGFNLGVALTMAGHHDQAADTYRAVLKAHPAHENARMNLSASLIAMGRPAAACVELRQLRACHPDSVDIFLNHASALIECGRFDEALEELALAPDAALRNLDIATLQGRALNGLRRHAEALTFFGEALDRDPNSADALNGTGVALTRLGRFSEAATHLQRAVEIAPEMMEAFNNLGVVLHQLGRLDDAIVAFDRAHTLTPRAADPLYNKSRILLLLGRFAEGWGLHESRKSLSKDAVGVNTTGLRDLRYVAQAKVRRLLVDWEQGLGDTIQFCRFAKLFADAGVQVTLRTQSPLRELIATLDPRIAVVTGEIDAAEFHFHIQTMSMPGLFKANAGSIPFAGGYLTADPARVEAWRLKIGGGGLRIGIAWQGNRQARVDLGRSFPLEMFLPLANLTGVRLISLQKNEGAEELAQLGAELGIEDLGPNFDAGDQAFLDSAAVMQQLDLVITSDTALAHLAGALGRPVWVALQHVPDWRWMLERADTPWYASMRLFRQSTPGDWQQVFDEMRDALAGLPRFPIAM